MASTVPAKSQPLHNFTLPHLKWNKAGNSRGQNQRRRSIKLPSRRSNISPASTLRPSLRDSISAMRTCYQSLLRDYSAKLSPTHGESSKPYPSREWVKHSLSGVDPLRHLTRHDLASESEVSRKGIVDSRRNHHSKKLTPDALRNRIQSTNSARAALKSEGKSRAKEVDKAEIKRSKILIKIPYKKNEAEENSSEKRLKIDNNDEDDGTDGLREEEKINNSIDDETKKWNLRPRRPTHKSQNGSAKQERSKPQSPTTNLNNRSVENDVNSGGSCGKKKKRKLNICIPLTKDEIEEDIFALTGSKPSKRPKKRPKNIQKHVDNCFPGLWLVSISAGSYSVSENSLKEKGN